MQCVSCGATTTEKQWYCPSCREPVAGRDVEFGTPARQPSPTVQPTSPVESPVGAPEVVPDRGPSVLPRRSPFLTQGRLALLLGVVLVVVIAVFVL